MYQVIHVLGTLELIDAATGDNILYPEHTWAQVGDLSGAHVR